MKGSERSPAAAMPRLAGCLLVMLLSLPASAEAPSAEKGAALLRQMKEACGGAAWDRVEGWHETGRVSLPQHPDARIDYWNDMHSLRYGYRASDGEAPLIRKGFDGTLYWAALPSGEVETTDDSGTLKEVRLGAYLSAFGYFLPDRFPAKVAYWGPHEEAGVLYHVIRIQPQDANSADLWVDAATNRTARIYSMYGVGKFSGYRDFDGVCAPTYVEQTDGATTTVQRLESIETGPVPEHRFSPPAI
jgi:hypothetical protein